MPHCRPGRLTQSDHAVKLSWIVRVSSNNDIIVDIVTRCTWLHQQTGFISRLPIAKPCENHDFRTCNTLHKINLRNLANHCNLKTMRN